MNLGLALSGGGFRATLFHLGVVKYLRDAGLLRHVTHVCSVSGGSVLGAHLVQNWECYAGSPREFDLAARDIIALVQSDVRGRVVRRSLTCLPTLLFREEGRFARYRVSATRLLETYYHQCLYRKARGEAECNSAAPVREGLLKELYSINFTRPFCEILATNLNYGTIASFTAEGYQFQPRDRATGVKPAQFHPAPRTRLALAVAASSAYPALFAPVRVTGKELQSSLGPLEYEVHRLTDGGIYDNLGVRRFLDLFEVGLYYPFLREEDVADRAGLVAGLAAGEAEVAGFAARLWDLISPSFRVELRAPRGLGPGLFIELNRLLHREGLYNEADWAGVALPDPLRALLVADPNPATRYGLALRNRLLMEAAFPGVIASCMSQPARVLVSDAGRSFDRVTEIKFSDFILSTSVRATDIVMNRVGEVERTEARKNKAFFFIDINEVVRQDADPTAPDESIQRELSQIRTDLDRFSTPEISGLIRHGYCLARQEVGTDSDADPESLHGAPWDPVRPPGYDYSRTNDEDLAALRRSKYRRLGLVSSRDWISYLQVLFLAAFALGVWWGANRVAVALRDSILLSQTGAAYANYRAPSIESWEVIDPYFVGAGRYEDVEQISQPDYNGFEVLGDDRIFDLTRWRPAEDFPRVDDSSVERYRGWVAGWRGREQAARDRQLRDQGEATVLTRVIRFRKKASPPDGSRTDEIRFQASTAGFGAIPRLDPVLDQGKHRWSVRRAESVAQVGARRTREWELVVELPEKPGELITLRAQVLYWNGFQGSPQWASVRLHSPVEEASVWVLLPDHKPYKNYSLQQYVIGRKAESMVTSATVLTDSQKTKFFWKIEPPDPKFIYEFQWTW